MPENCDALMTVHDLIDLLYDKVPDRNAAAARVTSSRASETGDVA